MDHLIGDNGENNFVFTAEYTVTDSDTDPNSDSFSVTVVDDIPDSGTPQTLVLSNSFSNSGTADLDFTMGADGPGSFELTMAMGAGGGQTALVDGASVFGKLDGGGAEILTSNEIALEWNDNGDGTWSAVTVGTLFVVFTVSVNPDGTYTIDMSGTIPLDGSFDSFTLEFGSNVSGGNSDLFFIFDSNAADNNTEGTTDGVPDGIPDGSTIMVLATAVDSEGAVDTVNTNANNLGVGTGQDIAVDDDGTGTNTNASEVLTLTFAEPKDSATVNLVGDITPKAVNFAKISFNALTVGEFAIVKLSILDGGGIFDHFIYIKVAATDLNGNPDEIITITQGDESLNTGMGTVDNPFVITTADYGAGLMATVFIEGSFHTVEFEADVDTNSTYKVSSIEGIDVTSGVDVDTTFTATATDADGDTVSDTFDVSFDSGVELTGTIGSDVLVANGADQILIGGFGDDTLTGAVGADTFVFNIGVDEGTDTITDFSLSEGDVLSFTDVLDIGGPAGIDTTDVIASYVDGGAPGAVDVVTLVGGTIINITDVDNAFASADDVFNNSMINGV
jgi:hypothetical protein